MEYFIFLGIASIIFLIIVAGAILYPLFKRANDGKKRTNIFSSEDAISQFLILLSLALTWVFFLSIDKQIGNPIPWRTILLLISIIAFGIIYFYKVLFALPFAIIGLASWWGMQSFESNKILSSEGIATFTGLSIFALLIYLTGRLHESFNQWKKYSNVYVILSLFFLTFSLFFISTREGLKFLNSSTGVASYGTLFFSFSLLIFSIFVLMGIFYGSSQRILGKLDSIFIFVLLLLFNLLNLIPAKSLFISGTYSYFQSSSTQLTTFGFLIAFIFNIILLLQLLALIFLGYTRKESWLITTGSFLIFIYIFIKYIDWFFSFMDKSLFFVGAGLLLFGVGWLMERGRKKMIQSMNSNEQESLSF